MKGTKKICSFLLAFLLVFTTIFGQGAKVNAKEEQTGGKENTATEMAEKTVSQQYAEAMAPGWNLGNTLDSYDTEKLGADIRETSWGNPAVVNELFANVKAQGFNSVRIPITFEGAIGDASTGYKVDEAWLQRINEVVDMALDNDLYVVVNVHHESWIWLSSWNGDKDAEEYQKFCAIWTQFADYLKEKDQKVSFETINEPTFDSNGEEKLEMINSAAYHIIRQSGGNNATRMILLPTLDTNHEQDIPLYNQMTSEFLINGKVDPNIIATMHYYSEWVFSANLGITGFDETLWESDYDFDYTARTAINVAFDRMYNQFTNNGIGVVIGEYGLLGYDSGMECNEPGEELKYYEYINYYAKKKGITLIFWDNGSGLDRATNGATWEKPVVGEWLTASMSGRSSYATGLDTIYLKQNADGSYPFDAVSIPLTLNGNSFVSIEDDNGQLIEGTDYMYDESSTTVTLASAYMKKIVEATGKDAYGVVSSLQFHFSSGAVWYETIRKCTAMEYISAASGSDEDSSVALQLHVNFNGNKIRRATAYSATSKIGPNSSWWSYLQYSSAYVADYDKDVIDIYQSFFDDSTASGVEKMVFHFELYNGDTVNCGVEKTSDGYKIYPYEESTSSSLSNTILVYEGETAIDKSYIADIVDVNEPYTILYGWGSPNNMITLDENNVVDYWLKPFTITSNETDQHAELNGDIRQFNKSVRYSCYLYVKKKPVVAAVAVKKNQSQKAKVTNLIGAQDQSVSYKVSDSSIAKVSADGVVTGLKQGSTKLLTTITQYGRTITVESAIAVEKEDIVTPAISMTKATVYAGNTTRFTIAGLEYGTVTATSSNSSVAKVNGTTITGVKAGSAVITVIIKKNDTVFTNKINVTVKASKIAFKKYKTAMNKGTTYTFTTTLTGVKGNVTYSSSNSSILSVNAKTGLVKAKKAGTASITATYNNGIVKLTATKKVSVKVPATSIKIVSNSSSKNVIYIVKGHSFRIGTVVKPLDTTDKVTYKSSDTKTATVSSTGKITAKKTGTVTIKATAGKKSVSVKVKVVAGKTNAKKITVPKKSVTVKAGKTYTILPTVAPIYSTSRLVFTSSNTRYATVDQYGVVTAKKAGIAYITVKSGGKSLKVKITVK